MRFDLFQPAFRGHATDLAQEAVSQGRKLVIAAGGDGMVGEVAQVLAGSEAVLGIRLRWRLRPSMM